MEKDREKKASNLRVTTDKINATQKLAKCLWDNGLTSLRLYFVKLNLVLKTFK